MDKDEMIALARRLAATARAETIRRFRAGGGVDDKGRPGWFDPVTEADREAERAMRALLQREHPDHGVSGEEFAARPSRGRFGWSLDPIDGTRSFICGLPTWTTLIALLEDRRPVLGVIDAPVLDELTIGWNGETRLIAASGETRLQVSSCTTLGEARLSTTDPAMFRDVPAFGRLAQQVRTIRYGHDGYAYARLAAGGLDLVVEQGLKTYDYQALIPVVRGAGGVIADWRGDDAFGGGRVIAAATPELFEAAQKMMAP